jgi:hypothetical protein
MLSGTDQPSCDIPRAFFKVWYRAPLINSAYHKSGTYTHRRHQYDGADRNGPGVAGTGLNL